MLYVFAKPCYVVFYFIILISKKYQVFLAFSVGAVAIDIVICDTIYILTYEDTMSTEKSLAIY